jgi:hypothetical protein
VEKEKKGGLFQGGGSSSTEKQASINMYSYEFESIMKGKKGDQLIKYLS